MFKFIARCIASENDTLIVSPSEYENKTHLVVAAEENATRARINLSKDKSLQLASEIFKHYGFEAPDFREYGVFVIPYSKVDNKITMIIRADGKLGFPGGKVEKGEGHEEALRREVIEEIGFVMNTKDLPVLCVDHIRDNFYSKCYMYRTDLAPHMVMQNFDKASHRCESMGWLAVDFNRESIEKLIATHQLASTVKEELLAFLEFMEL